MAADTQDFDVLIAGGGMVGASLALALVPLGLRAAIVEAMPVPVMHAPGYDDRATALSAGSRRILESIGIWPNLSANATPIRKVHVSEQGRLGTAWLEADELALDALGWVLENPRLQQAFHHALESQPGLTRWQPASVTSVEQDPDFITVKVKRDGSLHEVRTRLLVVADGARSSIREMLGIGFSHHDYGQSAIVANLTPRLAHAGIAWERFTAEGPLAFLPLTDNRCAIVWSVPASEAQSRMALPDDAFAHHVNFLFGERLGPITRLGRRQAWPLVQVLADSQRVGRAVLIGNAAHSLHPIAGQGFNLSLRDCVSLVRAISVGMDEASDPAHAPALARWKGERRADQTRVGQFTDGLNRLFLLDLPLVGKLRGVGIGAFGLAGPARRLLSRYGAGVGVPFS